MKKLIIIFTVINFIALVILAGYILTKPVSKRVYVETADVFSGFTMTKEYEKKLDDVKAIRQNVLDSIKLKLQVMSTTDKQSETFEFAKKEYLYKQEQFRQENEALTQKYNKEIWTQLNQYINDFGKEKKYEFIFGASGDGNMLYAGEGLNVTEEMIKYVNETYQGK